MCNFLQSVIKEMIGGQMEQLLLRQLTMRYIGFLLSAISFGFQVGEKTHFRILSLCYLSNSQNMPVTEKVEYLFYFTLFYFIFTKICCLWKATPKDFLKGRNLCILHKGIETLVMHGDGVNGPI